MKKTERKVSIVGAGPGATDLITVRGLNAIKSADAILYDALVNKALLKEAKPNCELIYVGKRNGKHSFKQSEINQLLIENAFNYQHVVRLKGGDPFIFGRGHEELTFLQAFNIEVDIIPGLSSATTLSGLNHIPLTKRGVNESFWVLTGTTSNGKLSKDIALATQSTATLVILMGIKKLVQIQQMLIKNGKANWPIAIIQNGSTQKEKIVFSTVIDIVEAVQDAKIGTPGIIIAGPVVALSNKNYLIETTANLWKQ